MPPEADPDQHGVNAPGGEPERSPDGPPAAEYQPPRGLLIFTRVVMPFGIAAAGVVLVVMGHGHYKSVFADRDSIYSAMGVAFWLVAGCILLLNWMMRMNADDAGDREKEDAARAFFVRHGRWPDEEAR